jgi:hypothetical protein
MDDMTGNAARIKQNVYNVLLKKPQWKKPYA